MSERERGAAAGTSTSACSSSSNEEVLQLSPSDPNPTSVMISTESPSPGPVQSTAQWTVVPNRGSLATAGVLLQSGVVLPPKKKSLLEAYLLAVPLGLLGAHHFYLGFHRFYLRNHGLGVFYFFTFTLLDISWLVDLFGKPSMVRDANSPRLWSHTQVYRQGTAHAFALSPAGIWGLITFTWIVLCGAACISSLWACWQLVISTAAMYPGEWFQL